MEIAQPLPALQEMEQPMLSPTRPSGPSMFYENTSDESLSQYDLDLLLTSDETLSSASDLDQHIRTIQQKPLGLRTANTTSALGVDINHVTSLRPFSEEPFDLENEKFAILARRTSHAGKRSSSWNLFKPKVKEIRMTGDVAFETTPKSALPNSKPRLSFSSSRPRPVSFSTTRSTTWTDNLPTLRAMGSPSQHQHLSTSVPANEMRISFDVHAANGSTSVVPEEGVLDTLGMAVTPGVRKQLGRFGLFRRGSISPSIEKVSGFLFTSGAEKERRKSKDMRKSAGEKLPNKPPNRTSTYASDSSSSPRDRHQHYNHLFGVERPISPPASPVLANRTCSPRPTSFREQSYDDSSTSESLSSPSQFRSSHLAPLNPLQQHAVFPSNNVLPHVQTVELVRTVSGSSASTATTSATEFSNSVSPARSPGQRLKSNATKPWWSPSKSNSSSRSSSKNRLDALPVAELGAGAGLSREFTVKSFRRNYTPPSNYQHPGHTSVTSSSFSSLSSTPDESKPSSLSIVTSITNNISPMTTPKVLKDGDLTLRNTVRRQFGSAHKRTLSAPNVKAAHRRSCPDYEDAVDDGDDEDEYGGPRHRSARLGMDGTSSESGDWSKSDAETESDSWSPKVQHRKNSILINPISKGRTRHQSMVIVPSMMLHLPPISTDDSTDPPVIIRHRSQSVLIIPPFKLSEKGEARRSSLTVAPSMAINIPAPVIDSVRDNQDSISMSPSSSPSNSTTTSNQITPKASQAFIGLTPLVSTTSPVSEKAQQKKRSSWNVWNV